MNQNIILNKDILGYMDKQNFLNIKDILNLSSINKTFNKIFKDSLTQRKKIYLRIKKNNSITLDYYTKKRVTQKELKTYINQEKKKLRLLKKNPIYDDKWLEKNRIYEEEEKLELLKNNLKEIIKEINELDKYYPTYIDKWLDNYNQARLKVGLSAVTEQELEKIKVCGIMDV